MKKYIQDKWLIIVLWLILLLIFIFGGMYSRYVSSSRESKINDYALVNTVTLVANQTDGTMHKLITQLNLNLDLIKGGNYYE